MEMPLFFNPAEETPAPGSLLDRHQRGEISAYAVNWAWLAGLDVATHSNLDALVAEDVECEALCQLLEASSDTTEPLHDDAFRDSALVTELVRRASVRLGNKQATYREVCDAIRARLAWSIAAWNVRQHGRSIENLPLHLRKPGTAATGVRGPLARRKSARVAWHPA